MNTGIKIIGFTAAALGVYKLSQLATTANNLHIIISDARIHKIDLTGIVFRCNVTLQNPTKTELNITQPFVKVYASESVITQTAVSNSVIKIAPLKDIPLNTIELPLSWNNAFSMLSSVGFKFPNGANSLIEKVMYITQNKSKFLNALKLKIEYSTYANGVFYKSSEILYDKTNGLGTLPVENPPYFGIGLVADFKRPLQSGAEYEENFQGVEEVDFKTNIVNNNGSVYDTINLMHKVVLRYLNDTKKLAPKLKGKTIEETAKNVWNFIYNHIQYELDKAGLEQLRRPLRSWKERKTGVDCDCYSIFASSILSNLKIPHYFRITEYANKGFFQHVYVVLHNEQGKEIIIDPVLNKFNQEKTFTDHKDFKMNHTIGIPIAILSGLDGDDDQQSKQFQKTPYYHHRIDEVFTSLFSGFGSYDAMGNPQSETLSQKDNNTIYTHLLETKKFLIANENNREALKVVAGEDPKAFNQMLDYAISHWNTPLRNKALEVLAANEMQFNMQLNGLGADEMAEIMGFNGSDEYEDLLGMLEENSLGKFKFKKPNIKKFFTNIKKAVEKPLAKAWQFVKKVNPITATIRAGFIAALKINMFKMSTRLRWGYASLEQIKKAGISEAQWEKAKDGVRQIEKMYVTLGGDAKFIKSAILSGKRKLSGVGSLGVVPIAVAATAAMPVIIKALDLIKKLGLSKKGDENAKEGGEDAEDDSLFNKIADTIIPTEGKEPETDETETEEPKMTASSPFSRIVQEKQQQINDIKKKYVDTKKPQPKPRYNPPTQENVIVESEEVNQIQNNTEPEKKSNTGLFIGLGVAAIAIAAIAMSKKEDKEESNDNEDTIDITQNQNAQPQLPPSQQQLPNNNTTQNIGKLPRKQKKKLKKLASLQLK